tara:strand:+ start:96804 stop:97928 length:1125 start_codon:yes stop_codon:yes gene_type:complete
MNTYLNLGGTIRSRTAEQTLQDIAPLAKKFGITRVANVTGLDCIGIPVATAIRPMGKNLSVSQGKGISLALAKVSAMMEAIENWYAERVPVADLQGSYEALSHDYCLANPTQFMQAEYVYDDVANQMLGWNQAVDLNTQALIYLPRDVLSLDTTQLQASSLVFSTSSNGLASGNGWHEAVCHALYEVIERDSFFHWQHDSDQQQTLVALDSIEYDIAKQLITTIQQADLQVRIWNMASENNIPAFHCAVGEAQVEAGMNVFSGTGAHLDKDVALCRAITEAVQARVTYITGSRDDVFPSYYQQQQQIELPEQNGELMYVDIVQPDFSHDFTQNIATLLQCLQTYKVDQVYCYTHADDDIAVVHVIAPQLRSQGS